jgi:hypothetical protein
MKTYLYEEKNPLKYPGVSASDGIMGKRSWLLLNSKVASMF